MKKKEIQNILLSLIEIGFVFHGTDIILEKKRPKCFYIDKSKFVSDGYIGVPTNKNGDYIYANISAGKEHEFFEKIDQKTDIIYVTKNLKYRVKKFLQRFKTGEFDFTYDILEEVECFHCGNPHEEYVEKYATEQNIHTVEQLISLIREKNYLHMEY